MATRSLVGTCLLSLWASGTADAQEVVVLAPPVPVLVPAPVVVVGPPPAAAVVTAPAAVPAGTAPAAREAPPAADQRNYPAGGQPAAQPQPQPQPQRPVAPRIVHERHYLTSNTSVSHYLSTKPAQTYGPETAVVIRDFYINDEPPRAAAPQTAAAVTPPAGGTTSANPPPRNSTDAEMDRILDSDRSRSPGMVNVPNAAAADNGSRNGNSSSSGRAGSSAGSTPPTPGSSTAPRINYPPPNPTNDETYGPPAPSSTSALGSNPAVVNTPSGSGAVATEPSPTDATTVTVASRSGTPMAEMELNFVDLAGTHADVKGKTDAKGQFQTRLPASRWQVFMVVGDNERKSLGVILVKPTANPEPFKLQFAGAPGA